MTGHAGLRTYSPFHSQIPERHTPSHTHRDRTPGERRGDRTQTGRRSRYTTSRRAGSACRRRTGGPTPKCTSHHLSPRTARQTPRLPARTRTPAARLGVRGDGGDGGVHLVAHEVFPLQTGRAVPVDGPPWLTIPTVPAVGGTGVPATVLHLSHTRDAGACARLSRRGVNVALKISSPCVDRLIDGSFDQRVDTLIRAVRQT